MASLEGSTSLEVGTSYRGGAARVAVVKREMRAEVNFILLTDGCGCWGVLFRCRWICSGRYIFFCRLVHIGVDLPSYN